MGYITHMMDPIEVVILTLDTPLAKVTRRLQKGAASNQTSPTGQYLIPNIGSVVGVMFPALLTLVQFDTVAPFSIVVAGLGTVQFVIGNVVKPALMGRTLNLSPLAIILSLTFWGTLWGFVGMSLCVPITVIVATVCSALRWIAVLLSSDGRLPDLPSAINPAPSSTR